MAQTFDMQSGRVGIATIKWVASIIGLLVLPVSYAMDMDMPGPEKLEENLVRWRSLGVKNYQIRFLKTGRYDEAAKRTLIVDVRNGVVHSAVYEYDKTPASIDDVPSIESLFIKMKNSFWEEGSMHYLNSVYYNAEYGYPEYSQFLEYDTPVWNSYHIRLELLMIAEEDANGLLHETPVEIETVSGRVRYNPDWSLEIARTIHNEMVSIPAGTFRMGDLSGVGNNNERPVRNVTVPAFRLGKYEVTAAQWNACLADGGCNGYYTGDWSLGSSYPADGVSWDDAQSFIDWLNNKTGRNYRLPTEAEWEYAARAGGTTEYSWGDDMVRWLLYCYDCYGSAPVNSFPANAWGLHNMHGNVAEWVQDCYHNSYEGAPTDGSARTSEDCIRRVIRGGSWNDDPWFLRSASRGRNALLIRSHGGIGFRLAHDE